MAGPQEINQSFWIHLWKSIGRDQFLHVATFFQKFNQKKCHYSKANAGLIKKPDSTIICAGIFPTFQWKYH